jgi:hypothetical protein
MHNFLKTNWTTFYHPFPACVLQISQHHIFWNNEKRDYVTTIS